MSLNAKVGKYSIHSPEAIAFVRKLTADEFVLDTMENGLLFDFVSEPGTYFEENNQSCLQNLEIVQKKVKSWLEKGLVSETKTKPFCCSPISVSEKVDYLTGSKKKRPCLDLSRHVNLFIKPNVFKLEDLNVSEKLLEQDDWMAAWDLESAYLHININEKHKKYLGFSLPDSSGKRKYFIFNVMIFGIRSAVYVMTTLTWPLMSHLHKRGIRASIYIDDGRIVAGSKLEATHHLNYALKLFENAGWNVQREKTSTEPVQKLYHMGFFCDTRTMKYYVTDFKISHLKEQLQSILAKPEKVKLKCLAAAAGKLMAAQKALGPVVPVCLRSSFLTIAQSSVNDTVDYESEVSIQDEVKNDLSFLLQNIESYNGYPIFPSKIGYCLNEALEAGDVNKAAEQLKDDEGLFVSDSSDIKAVSVGYNPFEKMENRIVIHNFTTSQRELSSSAREYLAVHTAILRLHQDIAKAGVHTIYWMTDSQVLHVWLRNGTRIKFIRQKLVELFRVLHQSSLRIVPIWKPRDNRLIQVTDAMSKFRDTDDWGISNKGFRVLQDIFKLQFTCDLFANSTNSKVSRFYSKVAAPGSHGINAFMMDWSQDICYACPPVKAVIDVYRYIQTVPAVGVLVVPYWQRNPFWPVITEDGIHAKKEFKKTYQFFPMIVAGEDARGSSFRTNVRKRMLALLFDTRHNNVPNLLQRCTLGGCNMCKTQH